MEINLKTCNKCKAQKSIEEFNKNQRRCKICLKEYRDSRKEKQAKYIREYYINNKESIKIKEKLRAEKNKERIKLYKSVWHKENKERISIKAKINAIKNCDHIKEYKRVYYLSNKERVSKKIKEYKNKRKAKDPLYKLQCNIRNRVSRSLQGFKSKRTEEIIGCTYIEFKKHLENQFESWMNWDNFGKCSSDEYNCTWHLDHIIPVSSAQTVTEIYLLNHWSNFQPLCGKKNLEKSSVIYPLTNLELNKTYE